MQNIVLLRGPFRLTPVVLGIVLLAFSASAQANSLLRTADPVVLTGSELTSLAGVAPGDVVAFRYSDGWQQIPVQIDERASVDMGKIYNSQPVGLAPFVYTEPGTFTGPDPNATFDADDELVFMARDAGNLAPTSRPAGVVPGTGVKIDVTDPVNPGTIGYVYLFRQLGTLNPAAGQNYVSYNFNLLSGGYKAAYNISNGPNPENSSVTTANYQTHFADRWVNDQLNVNVDGSTGVDILDRNKVGVQPGNGVRTEDTFSSGEGAFIANIDGPVRAIRSYVGANSGPYTERDQIYYDQRSDLITKLRVHAIGSSYDMFDYSPGATGMMYYNDVNPGGVTIDGVMSANEVSMNTALFPNGSVRNPNIVPIQWEMVTGPQGSVFHSFLLNSDIPALQLTSFYLDDASSHPLVDPVAGDPWCYGQSGAWLLGISNTDPTVSSNYGHLTATRLMYYRQPGQNVNDAITLNDYARSPLTHSVDEFVDVLAGDFNGDCTVDGADYVVWRETDGTQAGYNVWRSHFGQTAGSGAILRRAAVGRRTRAGKRFVAAHIRSSRRDSKRQQSRLASSINSLAVTHVKNPPSWHTFSDAQKLCRKTSADSSGCAEPIIDVHDFRGA